MKKIKIGTIILALTLAFVPACMASENSTSSKLIYQAVGKYKSGNFVGCIQDMNAVIDSGVKSDIAYYYQGLSYARLGFNDQAKAAYEEAAKISKNLSIIEYSNQGIKSLGSDGGGSSSKKEGEGSEDIGVFIKSRKFLHEDIEKEMRNKAIEDVKVKINKDKAPTSEDLKYINQNIPAPTDKEIADAVRTFARLGINPMTGYGSQIYGNNPALMQTGALLQAYGSQNNNNNNNFMNFAPYLLSMNANGSNNTEVNKNMIQAMMLSQMLPNLSFTSDDK